MDFGIADKMCLKCLSHLPLRKTSTQCFLIVFALNCSVKAIFPSECMDSAGRVILHGQEYFPIKEDPCVKCICRGGKKAKCHTIPCSPPKVCEDPLPIPGQCCIWKCKDGNVSYFNEDGYRPRLAGPGYYNVQNTEYVNISITQKENMIQGKEDLVVRCIPLQDFDQITGYTIHHKDITGNITKCKWTYFVKAKNITRECKNSAFKEKWIAELPLRNATLEIHIVSATITDSGNYSCGISAASRGQIIDGHSKWEEVEIKPEPPPPDGSPNATLIAEINTPVVIFVVVVFIIFHM